MAITPTPSYTDLLQTFQAYCTERLGTTNYSEGSGINLILQMMATEIERFYQLLGAAESSRDIELATGNDLDNLARPFGILRRSAQPAGASTAGPQVIVTNTTGSPIVLQTGMLFWSPSDPSTRFALVGTGITIGAGQNQSVQVQARQVGSSGAVGIGQLTAHNGVQGLVSVNVLPINSGRDQEDDDSFRYRITQTIRTSIVGGSSSLSGVQLYLESLPNILSVILVPLARGPASLDAIIVTESGLPDDDFLTSVQEQMASVCAAGISVRAKSPTIAGVTASVVLSIPPRTPTSGLKTLVTSLIQGYIDSRTPALPSRSYTAGIDASTINYSGLLSAVTAAVQSVVGNTGTVALLLAVDAQDPMQGDLIPSPGTVYRTNTVNLSVTNA